MTTAELFRLLWGGSPVGAAHPAAMMVPHGLAGPHGLKTRALRAAPTVPTGRRFPAGPPPATACPQLSDPGAGFPYLCAAWALVAMILATGAAWLTGAFDPPSYVSVDPATGRGMAGRTGIIASNLYSMGPFLLLIGLIGAFTLLTVQADGFRRVHGR